MKYYKRREEAGKMLLDISKYLITVGVIGSFIGEGISVILALCLLAIAAIAFIVGFYSIPENNKK